MSTKTNPTLDPHDLGYNYNVPAQDKITLSASNYNNTVIGGGYANGITNNGVISGAFGPYTVSTGVTSPWTATTAGQLTLNGEDADITVNGKSLAKAIEAIERRLNILTVNPELEKDWAELKELGDRYRKLEEHIKAKLKTWETLKKMPSPEIP